MKFIAPLLICLFIIASCSKKIKAPEVVPGVSIELAEFRKEHLSNINYDIALTIPENQEEDIKATQTVTFDLKGSGFDLQFDFAESSEKIIGVLVNGTSQNYSFEKEHIIISASDLNKGQNKVSFDFIAGDKSLNRNPDYLYTLFVPDRARTAFPVFDQPNLKATYTLKLDLPAEWNAISNGALLSETPKGDRTLFSFKESDKISTYLFSFVAGQFEKITRTLDGVEMTMLHRENDAEKVARNLDDIFDLHLASLRWLEDYTGINYPFQKFDFALIPAFQYGGMEHVGAIQYRAGGLFLDENVSEAQLLSRANLIAHETAHMWFGNLVTMDWFNDVWTKEVFASFMAAKIVNPSFPDVDHDLNFTVRMYPTAYSVDRTEGANPIRQDLPNLNGAGSLYGAIIYNKAPIMMRQLEGMIGEDMFREGMRDYLKAHYMSNATWPALIEILDGKSELDLKSWSEVWVNTPGRPEFYVEGETALRQTDPWGMDRVWPQSLGLSSLGSLSDVKTVQLNKKTEALGQEIEGSFINSDGQGYGIFPLSKDILQENWDDLSDLQRGSFFVGLYEHLLMNSGVITPIDYVSLLNWTIEREKNQLILNLLSGHLNRVFWSFLTLEQREEVGSDMVASLWQVLDASESPSHKKQIFNIIQSLSMTSENLEKLYQVWIEDLKPEGLTLSERDLTGLAATLAIKTPDRANEIIERQKTRIKNPDWKRRFEFLAPSLSPQKSVRDAFFESLKDVKNREVESWVGAALGYLHHPLRTGDSQAYLLPSLELVEELQVTGDIFFPGRWLGATLGNYTTPEAQSIVREFLKSRPDYNPQLRMKILQGADPIFRANKILAKPIS